MLLEKVASLPGVTFLGINQARRCARKRALASNRAQGNGFELLLTDGEIQELARGLQQASPDHVKTLTGTAQDMR